MSKQTVDAALSVIPDTHEVGLWVNCRSLGMTYLHNPVSPHSSLSFSHHYKVNSCILRPALTKMFCAATSPQQQKHSSLAGTLNCESEYSSSFSVDLIRYVLYKQRADKYGGCYLFSDFRSLIHSLYDWPTCLFQSVFKIHLISAYIYWPIPDNIV